MSNQKNFKRVTCLKIMISTNLFPIKDAIRHFIWLQQLSKDYSVKFRPEKGFESKKVQGLKLQKIWLPTWKTFPDYIKYFN